MADTKLAKRQRRAVKRGAALLDKYVPGWAEKVNGEILDGIFDMADPQHCVLGSLELVRQEGVADDVEPYVSFNGTLITSWAEGAEYGFDMQDEFFAEELENLPMGSGNIYAPLDQMWKSEIKKRINA